MSNTGWKTIYAWRSTPGACSRSIRRGARSQKAACRAYAIWWNPKRAQADADLLLYLKLDDDYLVVAQGADRMRHVGRDLRGRKMSDFTLSVGVVLKELYDACLAQQTAVYARFVTDLAVRRHLLGGAVFAGPRRRRRPTRFVASYATPIDNKTDVLQMVLDRLSTGTIVAVPVGPDRRNRFDGRIILINARAKKVLKFDEKGSRVNYIRDLLPWIRNIAGWTRVNLTIEGQQTRVQYRDRSNRTYSVTIESLNRFILFSIVENGGISPPRLVKMSLTPPARRRSGHSA